MSGVENKVLLGFIGEWDLSRHQKSFTETTVRTSRKFHRERVNLDLYITLATLEKNMIC